MSHPFTAPRLALSGTWLGRAPWRILAGGVALAVLVAAVLFYGLMRPSLMDVARLVLTLAVTCVLTVGLGYWLYRRGWARSTSLMTTLIAAYVWAALVTLLTVWVMQRQMFFSEHDLALSGVLLLFAAIIATTYALFVAASVTEGLRQMADAAGRLAAGDLGARVPVGGRDEVARLGISFNEMAGRLQATADRQRELDELRRNLIAWTSHDLRTPLTSIRVRVEALHDGMINAPDDVARYYETILSDVMALNSLIDDLFELAQLEAGGPALDRVPTMLTDLVSDCLESFAASAARQGITLAGDVDAAIGPWPLNASKISRVLNNLVENALRHTPSGGRVFVSAWPTAEGALVTVEDSGPGFAAADLPHVFDQFYRGEQSRSRATGSAGLGLAIARGIIQAHGGRIWAENDLRGGARVAFLLPRAALTEN